MSADKTTAKIGTLLDGSEARDAVHIAVLPAVAGDFYLEPGQRVGLGEDGRATHGNLGIVDPYLYKRVRPGQRFYIFLNPGTITSLRHEWTHPDVDGIALVEPKKEKPTKKESERWLREFVENESCPDFDTLIAAALGDEVEDNGDGHARAYEIFDEYLHFNGRDAHGDIPPEFWDHVENMTGRKVPVRAVAFSCGC